MTRIQSMWGVAAVLLSAQLMTACTTSLTTMRPTRALDSGEVQVTGGLIVPVATSAIDAVINLGEEAVDQALAAQDAGEPLTPEQERELTTSALALVLFQPAVVPEVAARVGIGFDVDLGLRYSGQLVKGEAHWQFWESEDGVLVSATLGFAHHLGPGTSVLQVAFDVLDFVKLVDYSRQDIDLRLSVGKDWGEWLSVYGAARYLVSFLDFGARLDDVESLTDQDIIDAGGAVHHVGVTGGLMVGYKYVFVNLELNVAQVFFEPSILGETQDLSGLIFAPGVGLTASF